MIPNRYQEFLALQARDTDECVAWPYSKSRTFGVVHDPNSPTTLTLTHLLSCTMAHGEPPTPKHQAAHSCHNPLCLNPRHLRWATKAEIRQASVLAGTSCGSKLTPADVRAIRSHPTANREATARRYGVSQPTIENVLTGKTWAWLP